MLHNVNVIDSFPGVPAHPATAGLLSSGVGLYWERCHHAKCSIPVRLADLEFCGDGLFYLRQAAGFLDPDGGGCGDHGGLLSYRIYSPPFIELRRVDGLSLPPEQDGLLRSDRVKTAFHSRPERF
jgi:hypothetical protein